MGRGISVLRLKSSLPVVVLMIAACVAQAGDYYWDINGTSAGAGGAVPGGLWDGNNTFWNSDAAGGSGTLTGDPATTDNLFLSAGSDAVGSYTLTLTGTRNAGNLTIEDGTPTLTGGTLNFGATVTITVNAGLSGAIGSAISGAGISLTKLGAGTLIFAGAVNSGSLAVNAGGVVLTNGSRLCSAGASSIGNGWNNSTVTVGTNSVWDAGAGNLNVGYGAATGNVFTINGGAVTNVQVLYFGYNSGANFNSLIISNGGLLVHNSLSVVGGYGAIGNRMLVDNSSLIYRNAIGQSLTLGQSGGVSNQVVVANGGQYIFAATSDGLVVGSYYNGGPGFNNSFIVTGTNALGQPSRLALGARTLRLGYWGARSNSVEVSNGGLLTNTTGIAIGGGTLGPPGSNGTYNSLVLTNGGLLFNGGVLQVGAYVNADYNWVQVDASYVTNSGGVVVGGVDGGTGCCYNSLTISNGAQLFSSAASSIGGCAGASSNWVAVGGTNSAALPATWNLGGQGLSIGGDPAATGNYLAVSAGGVVTNIQALTLSTNSDLLYLFNNQGGGYISCAAFTNYGGIAMKISDCLALLRTNRYDLLGAASITGDFTVTNSAVFVAGRSGSTVQATLNAGAEASPLPLSGGRGTVHLAPTNAGWVAVDSGSFAGPQIQVPLCVETNGAVRTVAELAAQLRSAGYTATNRNFMGFNLFLYFDKPPVALSYFAWDFTRFDAGLKVSQVRAGDPPHGTLMIVR